jgi:tetratricopeptide (TPR) repeat protein
LPTTTTLKGDSGAATAVWDDYLPTHPDSGAGYQGLADTCMMLGKLDCAEDALARAESLNSGYVFIKLSRWDLLTLEARFPEADSLARSLQMSSDPFRKFVASITLSRTAIRDGDKRLAVEELGKAASAYPEPGRFTALAHLAVANLLLETGDPTGALDEAREARRDGEGDWPEWMAVRPEALAEALAGRWDEAGKLSEDLKRFADSLPGNSYQQELHRLRGELAMVKGDSALASKELETAVGMLPRRAPSRPPSQHVPIWYAYATALMEQGRDEEAAHYFASPKRPRSDSRGRSTPCEVCTSSGRSTRSAETGRARGSTTGASCGIGKTAASTATGSRKPAPRCESLQGSSTTWIRPDASFSRVWIFPVGHRISILVTELAAPRPNTTGS